jgi:hypothetical protein
MRESIAQTFIVDLIIFFFAILILLFFGSVNYSKAFKAKNRIITIIEKYGIFDTDATTKSKVSEEIDYSLMNGGYQTTEKLNFCDKYKTESGAKEIIFPDPANKINRSYEYCVLKHENNGKIYYQVVTFMEFKVPLVDDITKLPVRGETKTFSDITS